MRWFRLFMLLWSVTFTLLALVVGDWWWAALQFVLVIYWGNEVAKYRDWLP